jgi:hypothetical protein
MSGHRHTLQVKTNNEAAIKPVETPVYIAAAATGSRSGRSSAAMEEGVRKVLRLDRAISCDTSSAVDGCWFIAASLSTSFSACSTHSGELSGMNLR